MPNVKKERLQDLRAASNFREKAQAVEEVGDIAALIAHDVIRPSWNQHSRWAMIHSLAKELITNGDDCVYVRQIAKNLPKGLSKADVKTAAFLTFLKFFVDIAMRYEVLKGIENGDAFEDEVRTLNRQIGEALQKQEATKIIKPVTEMPR